VSRKYISLYILYKTPCFYCGNRSYIGAASIKEPDKDFPADRRLCYVNITSRGHAEVWYVREDLALHFVVIDAWQCSAQLRKAQ